MVLKVHNLSLPLQDTPTGPVLSISKTFLDPIAWIVNTALGDDIEQFVDDLTRGVNIFIKTFSAIHLAPNDIVPEDQAQWRKLTGEELGEDVYMVGSSFTHEVILPRQTLLLIVQTLLKLRDEFPEPPASPWLFRAEPYDLAPTNGEDELMRNLEERAVAFKELLKWKYPFDRVVNEERTKLLHDLEEAGLFSEVYSEEKEYWLEMWELPTLLRIHLDALAFLNHFRPKPSGSQVSSNGSSAQAQHSTDGMGFEFALGASIAPLAVAG